MADVFLSYAREDRAFAERVARGLSAMGLDTFWDTEIPPGKTWADYIEGKLSACRAVIVLWSQHSAKSQWVREEARMGRDSAKLIPALIDGTPAPFGFGEVQAADLAGWTGDANHPGWARFANAVRAAAGVEAAPAVAPRPAAQFTPPPVSHAPASSAPAASPVEYVKQCLRLYADGKGRARRSEFGWFALFTFVAAFIAAVLDILAWGMNDYSGEANANWIMLLTFAALVCPFVAAASRRAHDFGQSGWLAALTVIPFLGWIAALVFVFVPGQSGANAHGPDPKTA
jgi:uncharacterized membrane protein YhaH (DUF805 family)